MKYKIEEGGIWDNKDFEIETDYPIDQYSNHCRHIKNGKIKAVVIAVNESGYNSTGVCLECIIEASEKIFNPSSNKDSK